jgi:ferredoxin
MQFRFHLLREIHLAWRAFCTDKRCTVCRIPAEISIGQHQEFTQINADMEYKAQRGLRLCVIPRLYALLQEGRTPNSATAASIAL